MATNTAAIQALYVAYFNRPADVAGLNYWDGVVTANKGSTAAVSAAFAASAEYKATYAGMDAGHVVAAIYQNLFGHQPDTAGLNYWVQLLLNNKITIDNVVTQIAGGALGTDLKAYNDKIAAATAFTNGLTTTAQQLGYGGDNANNLAKAWMSTIVDDASLAAAIDPAALAKTIATVTAPFVPPMTFNLTAGPDTWVGGSGNDTVIATSADGTKNYLTAFDNIDGGAGVNTLKFVDTSTIAAGGAFSPQAAGATVANFQNVTVASINDVNVDTTGFAGTTNLTVTAAGADAVGTVVKAADTTAVTVATATTGATTVTGGSAVAVIASAATAGNVSVTGAGLTTVSIKGGAVATVDNVDSKAASGKGTTLTAVTLDGITATGAAAAAVKGAGLTNVTLKNVAQTTGSDMTVTVTNATAKHALNLTVDTAGLSGKAAATVADAVATTVNVTAAGKSNIVVNAVKATALTVGGSAAITLNGVAGNNALTSVDASTSTGAVTVATLGTGVSSVLAGSGGLNATLNTVTSAATATTAAINLAVTGGAGADVIDVTGVTGSVANGAGTINVATGAGNDTIKATAAQLVAGNVIDGGAGTDTLVLANNTGALAAGDYAVLNAVVTNVEVLDLQNATAGIDASKMAFTTLQFENTGVVSGVSTQALITNGTSLTATAAGYAAGAPSTYAGTLNVTTTNAASALTLGADSAVVNVKATTSSGNVSTTIGGDLQTSLTVNATNSANASSSPTGDNLSSATILVNGANNTALKSIVLTGAGSVTIDASASGALTSVDASKLGGTIANGAAKGNITGGLTYTANAAIAETITLGTGADKVTTASSYSKMDTIVGFDAAKETSTGASVSDVLVITKAELGGAAVADLTINGTAPLAVGATAEPGLYKLTLAAVDTTLDLAFVHAAAASAANAAAGVPAVVQFQFGGNTYLFADTNMNGTLDNADFAIKLVGLVDVTGAFGIPPVGA